MPTIDATIVIFFATSIFCIIAWALRLEGRVNTADQRHLDLKELINTRFDSVDDRLDRVERSINGHLKS